MIRNSFPMLAAVSLYYLLILAAPVSTKGQNDGLRIPGDWERHEALWIGFRSLYSIGQYDDVILEVIKKVHPYVPVNVLVEQPAVLPEGPQLFQARGIDLNRIKIIYQSPAEVWLRDPGPVLARNNQNQLVALDFEYTDHQNIELEKRKPDVIRKEGIDRTLGKMVTPMSKRIEVVMEGGAFHTNGRGTMILVEAVTLPRNPHLTKAEIEHRLKKAGIAHQIIWLKEGLAEDPYYNSHITGSFYGSATGGHVDEFVRFVNDSTLFLSWVLEKDTSLHPIYAMNYHRLNDAYQVLEKSRDERGRPFHIVKIPHPDLFYETMILGPEYFPPIISKPFPGTQPGDTINYVGCASYMNYLITNGLILLPEYWMEGFSPRHKEKEQAVLAIFKKYFPEREILRINPLLLNFHGGGIHCIYQEQPAVEPQKTTETPKVRAKVK